MEDLFKKVIYTGVGLVSTTAEKIQTNIDELVKKGSLSEEEGKKVVEDLLENTESKKEEFEGKLKEMINNAIEALNLPSKSDIDNLMTRIKELETKAKKK